MAADEYRRPDGTWSCTRDHVTQPCGDCDGCRVVAAENRMLGDLENWQPSGLADLPANPVIAGQRGYGHDHQAGRQCRIADIRGLLPWLVRLRLRLASRVNHAGCWLVEHDHIRAARLLWRI